MSLSKYIKDVEPIRGDLALPIADKIISIIQSKYKDIKICVLGSTGKKTKEQYSGDIDIALEFKWENYNEILQYILTETSCVLGNINDKLNVFNIGYQYKDGNIGKIVQIDFMFVDNIEFSKFSYHSPNYINNESKYKGMYCSALFMAIVKSAPITIALSPHFNTEFFALGNIKSYWELFFNQNSGLYAYHKTFESPRTHKIIKNPQTIEKVFITDNVGSIINICLGPLATLSDCNSFETLFDFIHSNSYIYKTDNVLKSIKDAFMNDWQLNMKTAKEDMDKFENMFNNIWHS